MSCKDCNCSHRATAADCTYCNKSNYNGGFYTQVMHVSLHHIEHTNIETKFCPHCGRKLES